jgi:hypothetical protein
VADWQSALAATKPVRLLLSVARNCILSAN